MARRFKLRARAVFVAAAVAFAVALVTGLVSYMLLAYRYGGINVGQRFYSGMAVCFWKMGGHLAHRRAPVDVLWWGMVVFGGVLMALLLLLRKRHCRFPLPPICLPIVCLGTVMFQTGMNELHPAYSAGPYVCFVWGPFLVAFIIKKLLLRLGGMDLYLRALPLALGLVTGQCVMIVFWNVYHALAQPKNMLVFTGVFN
jgi:hypothetical protein